MTDDQSTENSATVPELLRRARRAGTAAALRTGEFGAALAAAEAALTRARLAGDRLGEAEATVLLGLLRHDRNTVTALHGGQVEDAAVAAEETLLRDGFALAEALGAQACAAAALFGLGLVEQDYHGDWNEAMPYYRRAEALIPALAASGDRYIRSEIHRRLGLHHLVADEQPALALRHLRIAHELRKAEGDPLRIAGGLIALGRAERANGLYEQAVRTLRRALGEARAAGLLPIWVAQAERELRAAERALPDAPGPG
jgi:tetratricopeptide (TPR) repeat protein